MPHALPPPGSPTAFAKIVAQSEEGFEIEGIGETVAELEVRFNRTPAQIAGATLQPTLERGKLLVRFPAGQGYQRTAVRFTW